MYNHIHTKLNQGDDEAAMLADTYIQQTYGKVSTPHNKDYRYLRREVKRAYMEGVKVGRHQVDEVTLHEMG